MPTPFSNSDKFNQNKAQWSGNQTVDNSSAQPILNELNWSVNPNTYVNGKKPQSFWSPADGSDLKPIIWNDFVVVSATANFSNNGNSASTLNMKLIPNKTFFERAKATKHYTTLFDPTYGVGHDRNEYSSSITEKNITYTYIPNVGSVPNNISVYTGNTFSNFDYKTLDSSNPRYDSQSFVRNGFGDKNLIFSDDGPDSILSPDGLPLFLKPWYTRIGEPTNLSIGKFNFGGIISSWKIIKGSDGFHYECVITDPTEILKGVNIIVSNYKGPSGYFNVINAFGYFESITGGDPYNKTYNYVRQPKVDTNATSDVDIQYLPENNFNYNVNNDIIGMRISDIAYCLGALLRAPSSTFDLKNQYGQIESPRVYGGPIVFGHRETMNWYNVDLSIFNLVAENYFVEGSGGVISLYDLFSMICSDAGYDMIVTLEGNNIKPKFVNRNFASSENTIPLAIQSLSSSGNNVIDSSYGYELIEQNTTGQLLIGSPKEIFYQTTAIRSVYGSNRGQPILGIPGKITITLPSLVQFNNLPENEGVKRLGEVGSINVILTKNVKNQINGKIEKIPIGNSRARIGFYSKQFDVEFVKIPLPLQIVKYFGVEYVTNTLEMMLVKSQNGSVLWEKYLRYAKPSLWKFLYGYEEDGVNDVSQLPKDHSQTGSVAIDEIYEEKMGYSSLSRDELANRLFQNITSYADSWGKYYAVSLPDKASFIGVENEFNISKNFNSLKTESETLYNGSLGPTLGNRKFHYNTKSETYIDVNPYWNESNIYYPNAKGEYFKRSTVVNSQNFPSQSNISYPMDMQENTLGQFLNDSQSIGPVAEYTNLRLFLSDSSTISEDGEVVGSFNIKEPDPDLQSLNSPNYLGYSGNDFLNGIYPNNEKETLVAKGNLVENLTFMHPLFSMELDKVEPYNSLITLNQPQVNFGVTYEEEFYGSDTMAGAYNDIVIDEYEYNDVIGEKLKIILDKRNAVNDLENPDLSVTYAPEVIEEINNLYQNFDGKKKKYKYKGYPYIYGYFTVVEIPNHPYYGMSKKAEMQEFMMYLEGLDAGNIDVESMAAVSNENVFPFRIKGPPIFPSRIGVPLSLTFDNWVFRDDPDAYGKTSRSKYPYIGKVSVQIDESLNPLNYGGFSYFFSAAQAKIKAISPQRQNESGSITFVGIPSGSLGDCLAIDGNLSSEKAANLGPSLTGISISFDPTKVTTTYEFKNFAPRFGVTSREYIDRIKNTGNQAQKARILAIKQTNARNNSITGTNSSPQYVSRYHDRQPPHEVIYFRQFGFPKRGNMRVSSKSGTEQEFLRDIKPNLSSIALASWDAFLSPYTLRSLPITGINYAYGISPSKNFADVSGYVFTASSSGTIDNWPSFKNPKINLINRLENIKDYQNLTEEEKSTMAWLDFYDKEYKYYLSLDTTGLNAEQSGRIKILETGLYTRKNLFTSVNNYLLNPVPKEYNIDSLIYKKDEKNITNVRGTKGAEAAKYVTSIGLKGPLVVTGWGIDKHFSNSSGLQFVGTGSLFSVDNSGNYPSGVKNAGDQGQFLTGPVDLLWDSYRGTWSTKDTELVYVKSYEKMPSGHFGYLANCIPLNFIDDFNSTGSLKNYPMIATGLLSKESWKDNLQKITAGTGDGFKTFYSIKPQTGCIYTATFINNSVSNVSGICSWMLNPEAPIMGIYSSGSIYDMFGRIFNENVDFMHPEDFGLNVPGSLTITNFSLVDNVVTLTYSGISNYTIGDKIKIGLKPANPTYDGEYVITNIDANTISYIYYGDDDEIDGDEIGYIDEPVYSAIAKKQLRQKVSEKAAVLLKVFPASKATYNVVGIGGGTTSGTGVKSVQCVNNILVVTYS
jgi:hypothetical protein